MEREQTELRQHVTNVESRLTGQLTEVCNRLAELIAMAGNVNTFIAASSEHEQSPFAAMFSEVIGATMASVVASGVLNRQLHGHIQQDMDARVGYVRDWARATFVPIQFPSAVHGSDLSSSIGQESAAQNVHDPQPTGPPLPPATHPIFPIESEGRPRTMVPVASDDDLATELGPQILPASNVSALHSVANKSRFIPQNIHLGQQATANTTATFPPYADFQATEDRGIADQLAGTSLNDRHALIVNSADRSAPHKVSGTQEPFQCLVSLGGQHLQCSSLRDQQAGNDDVAAQKTCASDRSDQRAEGSADIPTSAIDPGAHFEQAIHAQALAEAVPTLVSDQEACAVDAQSPTSHAAQDNPVTPPALQSQEDVDMDPSTPLASANVRVDESHPSDGKNVDSESDISFS